MAETTETTTQDAGDRHEAFLNATAAKYEAEDAAAVSAEDGMDDEDAGQGTHDDDDDADDSSGEDTDEDTSSDGSDGSADDSDEDSHEDDDAEHPDDDESPDSDDDDEASDDDDGDEEDGDEDEDEAIDEKTSSALAAKGADLKLEDVPEEYRGIVTKKLKSVDAAFTRVMQEATAFRSERTTFQAEERYRKENPDLVIVEMLRADPELFDKVNDRITKLEGDDTNAEAFKIVVDGKRKDAVKAVQDELDSHERVHTHAREVAAHVEKRAAALGLPFRIADRAIAAEINLKPADQRDITNEEIEAILKVEAREYQKLNRGVKRQESKDRVKAGTASRRAAAPVVKKPAGSASPRPGVKKAAKVDHNSEESRQSAMMRTARRVAPGTRDQ